MNHRELAEEAVRHADSLGKENREQFAILWLYERGDYAGLTYDEANDLDSHVRLACVRITPPS